RGWVRARPAGRIRGCDGTLSRRGEGCKETGPFPVAATTRPGPRTSVLREYLVVSISFPGGDMPTLLDNLETRSTESWNRPAITGAAEGLRTTMAAVRVAFTWWGVQRALTADQKARAAQAFDAEGQFLSAGKNCLTPRRPHSAP